MSGHFQLLGLFSQGQKQGRRADSLEHSTSIDEHVAFIVNEFATRPFDLELPLALGVIPASAFDGVAELHVVVGIVLVRNILHVVEDLLRSGVIIRPVWVRAEAV